MEATTLTLDDGHYPSFREIRGLAFPISIVISALGLAPEQELLREVQAERLVTAWNAHDKLLAAVRMLRADHDMMEPHHAHLCSICQAADAAIAAATE